MLQVLVDYNAGTRVSDVKLRSIPLLRGDVAAYVSHAFVSPSYRRATGNGPLAIFAATVNLQSHIGSLT